MGLLLGCALSLILLFTAADLPLVAADPTPEANAFATIRVSVESLRTPLQTPGATLADALKSLTATVEGRVCATVDLRGASNTDSDGNKVLVLGTEDQPAACRASSGTIVFIDGNGLQLVTQLPLAPGTSQLLTNLGPVPPGQAPTRGFLAASVTAEGVGPVRGDGRTVPGQSLLIVPASQPQPLSVRDAVPLIYPIEASGKVNVALPVGDYLVIYNNVEFSLTGVQDSIQVQSNQLITFPAARVTVPTGATTSVALTAIAKPQTAPLPFITELQPGGGAIHVPDTGDAGLVRQR